MMTVNPIFVAVIPLAGVEADTIVARWADGAEPASVPRHTTEIGRRRSSVARALLRGVLKDLTGIEGRKWLFPTAENGKPLTKLLCGTEGPAVSISHSGEFVAVAAATSGLIGIDVERRRPDRPLPALAKFAFGPKERSEAEESCEAFYKIWTLREAMAKATGEGLPRATDGRDRVAGTRKAGVWTQRERRHFWRLGHFEHVADYSLAVALRSSAHDITEPWSEDSITWWDAELLGPSSKVPTRVI